MFLVMSLSLFLFSCSSIPDKDTENTSGEEVKEINAEDLKTMSDEIISLVEPNSSENSVNQQLDDNSVNKVVIIENKNLYLAQESQLTANISKDIMAKYKQALAAMDKKEWPLANELFDQVIYSQPKLSGTYVNKALIAMAENKMIIAQFQIDKAIKANNINPYAYNIKGQLSRLNGDFIKAEQSYNKALSIWPNFAEVHWNLAVLLELYRGRYAEAKVYYLSFLQLRPEDEKVKRSIAGLDIKIARARKE